MEKRIFLFGFVFFLGFLGEAYAHCPLCTLGAGAAAVGAKWLGVSNVVLGVFIGAFAVALGVWMTRIIKKKYVPYQTIILVLLSYFLTVLPLISLMQGYSSVYISLVGDYGSLLNRTYMFNSFLVGSIIGGSLVLISPYISRKVTKLRKEKMLPFQGVTITFLLLILFSFLLEGIL